MRTIYFANLKFKKIVIRCRFVKLFSLIHAYVVSMLARKTSHFYKTKTSNYPMLNCQYHHKDKEHYLRISYLYKYKKKTVITLPRSLAYYIYMWRSRHWMGQCEQRNKK